ncbi:MAG: SURF1 family protein [Pseudomonadales bacterium]|jgi:surfeit locus 1 family protein|nr:SURF1 family protein [Pseudomonadales bacterium]
MTEPRVRQGWGFRPGIRLSLFVLAFLPLLIVLGTWQLGRADEKARIEAEDRLRAAEAPIDLEGFLASGPDARDLTRVQVLGEILRTRVFLLDNRTWQGRTGYEVVAPVAFDAATAVLVNFGWVPAPARRAELPEILLPPGRVRITGRALLAPDQTPVFDSAPETGWPRRVQRIDASVLEPLVEDRALLPFLVVADADAPGAQQYVWQPVRMSADRHRAYAAQWFGLALVLVVGWIAASLQRPARAREERDR